MEENFSSKTNSDKQTIIIQNDVKQNKSNGIGVAGFVLAILSLFTFFIPFLNFIIWLLGLIFSSAGLYRASKDKDLPKGLSIAGLVLSLIGLLFLLMFIGLAATFLGAGTLM